MDRGLAAARRWVPPAALGTAFLAVVALVPLLITSWSGPDTGGSVRPVPTASALPAPTGPPDLPAPGDPTGSTAPTGPAAPTGSPGTPSARTPGATSGSPAGLTAGLPAGATARAASGGTASSARPGAATSLRVPVQPRPVTTPPRTQYQEFLSVCAPLGRGRAPLDRGSATSVAFLGAPPAVAGVTAPAGAVPGRSSCTTTGDGSTYWAPELTVAGTPVEPTGEIYYKSAVRDYPSVQPFPAGLRLVTGDLAAATASGRTGSWSCGGARSPGLPASCPAGSKLVVRVQSPGCWDGVRLDSPDHRAHVADPLDGRCPGTHPVAIPMLEVKLVYTVPAGPLDARLTTGDGSTFGVGFVAGWDPAVLDRLVATCIDRGVRCGRDGLPA